MKKLLTVAACLAAFFVGGQHLASAEPYVPSEGNMQAREKFQDSKFGIFIHWGLYSMLGTGEWTMTNANINYKEYAKLADAFYPHNFNADAWVSAIKASGAKYICFTTRHHDGFSMWNTEQSDYNIVDATPYKTDIVKALADECHAQGIDLHLYYSLIDWYRDDCPRGRTGLGTGRPGTSISYEHYYDFMSGQLTELLTNYGKIGAIWFDGIWDQDQNPDFDWKMRGLYDLIHDIDASCLIGNNHHSAPHEGEDFQLFEQDLPGENSAGFSGGQKVSDALPLESCQTMNSTWGYSITDKSYKSADELIRRLVKSAGMNSNLLLNIGPRPDGCLPDEAMERLKEIGKWTKRYGETIFGTRGGLIKPCQWGVSTQKGDTLYLHILHLEERTLTIPLDTKEIKSARMYDDGSKLKIRKAGNGSALISLPATPQGVDTIVEIVLRKQKRG